MFDSSPTWFEKLPKKKVEKDKHYHVLPAPKLDNPGRPRREGTGTEVSPSVNLDKMCQPGQDREGQRGTLNKPSILMVGWRGVCSILYLNIKNVVACPLITLCSVFCMFWLVYRMCCISDSFALDTYSIHEYQRLLPKVHPPLGVRQSSRQPSNGQSQLQRRSRTSEEGHCLSA